MTYNNTMTNYIIDNMGQFLNIKHINLIRCINKEHKYIVDDIETTLYKKAKNR